MKARNAPAESLSASPAPVSAKKPASAANLLTRCALTFGTLAWLELGCAGVRTRPANDVLRGLARVKVAADPADHDQAE